MDTDGARRLNRSSPSCLNRPAQQTDFFHGLIGLLGTIGLLLTLALWTAGTDGAERFERAGEKIKLGIVGRAVMEVATWGTGIDVDACLAARAAIQADPREPAGPALDRRTIEARARALCPKRP